MFSKCSMLFPKRTSPHPLHALSLLGHLGSARNTGLHLKSLHSCFLHHFKKIFLNNLFECWAGRAGELSREGGSSREGNCLRDSTEHLSIGYQPQPGCFHPLQPSTDFQTRTNTTAYHINSAGCQSALPALHQIPVLWTAKWSQWSYKRRSTEYGLDIGHRGGHGGVLLQFCF